MKNKNAFFAGLLVIVVIVIALIIFLVPKKSKAPAAVDSNPGTQTQPANLVSIAPTQISVTASSTIYAITGSIPQFPQAGVGFNQKITIILSLDIAQFKADANADYAARQKTMSAADLKSYYGNGPVYTFDMSSTVVQSNANYVSVVVRENEYTGGAHPFTNIEAYNYDLKNQKDLTLADFMTLADASSAAQAQLAPQLAAASDETTLDANTQQMLQEGTDPTDAYNFSKFTFTNSDATIYFPSAQVAPDVFGEQDVTIPIPAK
jgi:peptidoglycan-N-acetylmuramic acid deacetylase PdaC-like protein/uncharacterized protein DUF3298